MSVVELTVADGIATVRLNRPEVMNAMSPEMTVKLYECWLKVRDDPAIHVAILTGAGDKSFCSGADLALYIPLLTGARQPGDEYDRAVVADPTIPHKASLRNFDVGKPVIAAVNGYALAGGMEMLQGVDLRIASTTARFGLREVQRGLIAAGSSCVRMPRQIPYVKAMEILLTGEMFDAQHMLDIGYLNYVVPPEELMPRALSIARRIADNGPLAVRVTRAAVRDTINMPEPEALDLEWKMAQTVWDSEDAREGPRAFFEKRPPRFKGR